MTPRRLETATAPVVDAFVRGLAVVLCVACGAEPAGQTRPAASSGGAATNAAISAGATAPPTTAAGATATTTFGGASQQTVDGGPNATLPATPGADNVLNASCATATVRTQLVPSNMLFVIDRSGSMNCNPPPTTASPACELEPTRADPAQPNKWEITQAALKAAFARLPASTGVGLSFFSVDDVCGVNSMPSVPIAELVPAQLSLLGQTLDSTQPGGGTPLVGATILAYKHLHTRALSGQRSGNDVVVLLTDGEQSEQCGSARCATTAECIQLLLHDEVPKSASPGADIRTFVIGAPGSEPARAMLSQMAIEGHTARPGCDPAADDCHLDMTKQSDFSAALSEALASISGETARCELPLPDASADADAGTGQLDLARLNVVFTPGQGAASVVPRDERAACATANGWQYDATKGALRLCGDACARLRLEPSARIDVVLGCPVQGPS